MTSGQDWKDIWTGLEDIMTSELLTAPGPRSLMAPKGAGGYIYIYIYTYMYIYIYMYVSITGPTHFQSTEP